VSKSIRWEQGDYAERRAIDFFRCRTAPSVSSYFDTDFVSILGSMIIDRFCRHLLIDHPSRSGRLWSCKCHKASLPCATLWSQ
jgi:hypothetical protein